MIIWRALRKASRTGHFQVQDISSMEVAEWAAPKEGRVYYRCVCSTGWQSRCIWQISLQGTGTWRSKGSDADYKVDLIQ